MAQLLTGGLVDGVLLHLVLVGVRSGSPSPPEAVLAELVAIAALALVPKAQERVPITAITLHRVQHCTRGQTK